jgi:hypothetical protein
MLEAIGEAILEVSCTMTGHVVLWALTGGRWQLFNSRHDIATLAGILFWVLLAIAVWAVFFR